VVSVHEIIHRAIKKRENGVVLKLDYEKAYDRVNWSFLGELMISRGFGRRWIGWIMKMVKGGSICIRINDVNSSFSFFRPSKGLRQGDPLSLLLFNLVVDVLTRMLSKAALKGYISGFMDDVCRGV
jgi:hypothetical protein